MTFKNFGAYKQFREANENKASEKDKDLGLGAKVTLGEDNDYEPFEVSDDPKSESYGKNKNLAPIIRAFKSGANWGWSRDDKKGSDKPVKIGSKKLYLAGGAVRSHLKGEKPRNIELATNASPDEVYHILKQNKFEYVGKDEGAGRKRGKQTFWVNKANKNGRPFSFGIQVNEDEYELEVFRKTPRGIEHEGDEPEPGTHKEDASGRDFTINSMYILLSNDNGPNKELQDFHSGIHHLKSGRVVPIGGMKTLEKHPSRVIRMIRFMNADGDPKTLSDEDKAHLAKAAKNLPKSLDRKYTMDQFKKGMKKGTDHRKYFSLISDLGVGDSLFPGMMLDTKLPKEISEIEDDGDASLAYALRSNNPDSLKELGLDTSKIEVLIKLLGLNDLDPEKLEDLTKSYTKSGITTRGLKNWGLKIAKADPKILERFLSHCLSPRVKVSFDEQGEEKVDERFADLIDRFTGMPQREEIENRRKCIEFENFLRKM